MFYKKTYKNKDIVIVPKSNDKNSLKTINKVDVKPNNNNKTYENIRNMVQNDGKPVDIKSIPKNDNNIKKLFSTYFLNQDIYGKY